MVENIDETKTILNTNEVSLRYLNNNFMDTKMKFERASTYNFGATKLNRRRVSGATPDKQGCV